MVFYVNFQSLIGHFDLDPNRVFDIVSYIPFLASITYISFFRFIQSSLEKNNLFLWLHQVLECFELYPDNNMFYNLIPLFPKVCSDQHLVLNIYLLNIILAHPFHGFCFQQSHAAQILGFKFQYYQRVEVNNPVPSGLYRLAAFLVKAEFIDLDSL